MAERDRERLGPAAWFLALGVTAVSVPAVPDSMWLVAGWAVVIAGAQLITVPAPGGDRIRLGPGVAAGVPLLFGAVATVAAIYAGAMVLAWPLQRMAPTERRTAALDHLAEVVALAAFAAATLGALWGFRRSGAEGDLARLIAVGAGGLAWYVGRASIRAVAGFDRDDLSPRYLWLLGLEDWPVIVSMFASGAIFGFAYPVMGLWSLPVALMPYGFSHLAFVQYADTRITYGQTIRALARIPEVAGLAPDGHATRTSDLSLAMARELGMHPDEVAELEYAALMHDIGRVTLNEPAILKAGYTAEDLSRWGSQIIAEAPYLARVSELVREHHRPYRSPGVERDPDVALASRIIKVASAYDRAVHEMGLRPVVALEQIHQGAAYEYDPLVAASLRRVLVHRGVVEY
jgi:hypothetical protein